MSRGAIVLCGGQSSRMGTAKLALPFGPETMLARILRLLGEVCDPIVVVAGADQQLPECLARAASGESCSIIIARDRQRGRGPLEGLAAGLAALPVAVEAAYATSCDVPLLVPAFVERLFALLADYAAVVPTSGGFLHPLSAVYRRGVLDVAEQLLAADRLRPSDLFDVVPTRRVEKRELIDVDPRLDTLWNLNCPADYLAALERAGFTAPHGILAGLKKAPKAPPPPTV